MTRPTPCWWPPTCSHRRSTTSTPCFLVTTSLRLANDVDHQIELQLADLPTSSVARQALTNGFSLVVGSLDEAVSAAERLAPEHLALHVEQPGICWEAHVLARCSSVGAVPRRSPTTGSAPTTSSHRGRSQVPIRALGHDLPQGSYLVTARRSVELVEDTVLLARLRARGPCQSGSDQGRGRLAPPNPEADRRQVLVPIRRRRREASEGIRRRTGPVSMSTATSMSRSSVLTAGLGIGKHPSQHGVSAVSPARHNDARARSPHDLGRHSENICPASISERKAFILCNNSTRSSLND